MFGILYSNVSPLYVYETDKSNQGFADNFYKLKVYNVRLSTHAYKLI